MASRLGRVSLGIRPAFTSTRVARVSPVLSPARRNIVKPVRALEIDWSDPDTQVGLAGVVLGLVFGIGAPWFYIRQTEKDEELLEEVRSLNRSNFAETGEYLTEEEISKIRKPKWTDRREWQDDD